MKTTLGRLEVTFGGDRHSRNRTKFLGFAKAYEWRHDQDATGKACEQGVLNDQEANNYAVASRSPKSRGGGSF